MSDQPEVFEDSLPTGSSAAAPAPGMFDALASPLPNLPLAPPLPADFDESRFQHIEHDPLGLQELREAETLAVQAREHLDAEHEQIVRTLGEDLAHQAAQLEAGKIDLDAIRAADPGFADQGFLNIARESLNLVREARAMRNPELAQGILSAQLRSELDNVVAGDVASHRHHLLPGLWISGAEITHASVTAGELNVMVRYHIKSEELERDDNLQMVAGSTQELEWDEDWTFWRDPTMNASASDEDHILRRHAEGGWMFAHRGWIVTAIKRL